jgi:excinuclease ABC subunit A
MEPDAITIVGAREHNLRDVSLEIPKKKLIVFTGPSGSGKSSLAFDTLYAEGQRRYVESLSSYARQFLGQLEKPRYDSIRGLSPTISIEQKAASNNPRSTVGTITEISDYLRVLFARVGVQHCPRCGRVVRRSSAEAIVRQLQALEPGRKVMVLAPVIENRKGEFREVLDGLRREGIVRIRANGEVKDLSSVDALDKRRKHQVEAVVDRLVTGQADLRRLTDSVETALKLGGGKLVVAFADARPGVASERGANAAAAESQDRIFSERLACEPCGIAFPELSPQRFSFNSPLGMCVACNGLGTSLEVDPDKLIPDPTKSLDEGAVVVWKLENGFSWGSDVVRGVCEAYGIDRKRPWAKLTERQRHAILHGSGGEKVNVTWERERSKGNFEMKWEGLLPAYKRRFLQTQSDEMKQWYAKFMTARPCESCEGGRLREESRHVRFFGKTIVETHALSIEELARFFSALALSETEERIAGELLKEIRARLRFLLDVGLGYLSLARPGPTLSGGESQRIRLASQIGSELTGVIYVLDEPSIGLHQRDNDRLLRTLVHLRDIGNTVIVVEHDLDTILAADHVVDFGPGAGVRGGRIVAHGTPAEIAANEASLTGAYLSGRREIPLPERRRAPRAPRPGEEAAPTKKGRGRPPAARESSPAASADEGPAWIEALGAEANNLRGIDALFPIGLLTVVTGVSGAGKSTLVNHVLLPAAQAALRARGGGGGDDDGPSRPGANGDDDERDAAMAAALAGGQAVIGKVRAIRGLEAFDKVIEIDQRPIGRTPRSNPATYTKLFDAIRDFFAGLPQAKMYGYSPGRFSFNVKGGRCETCKGDGSRKIEMHFLADVYVTCEDCKGRRFNEATLQVKYRGKSIADVLDLSVAEAVELFADHPQIVKTLKTLVDVGIDYMHLGQSATTLSGGEAQRVKLSRELAKRATGRTLYVLDEPSTGLHLDDVRRLLDVLQRLVDAGNTVIVIEHNLDIVKVADWVVDVGPEGGAGGGRIVAEGTPEEVARCEASYTGRYLSPVLARGRGGRTAIAGGAAGRAAARAGR